MEHLRFNKVDYTTDGNDNRPARGAHLNRVCFISVGGGNLAKVSAYISMQNKGWFINTIQ
jgi:hypothetical protein